MAIWRFQNLMKYDRGPKQCLGLSLYIKYICQSICPNFQPIHIYLTIKFFRLNFNERVMVLLSNFNQRTLLHDI